MSSIIIQQKYFSNKGRTRTLDNTSQIQFCCPNQLKIDTKKKDNKTVFWEFLKKNLVQISLGALIAIAMGVTTLIMRKKIPEQNLCKTPDTPERTSPQIKKLDQRVALAKEVCEDGNFNSHCQTIAPLNALRIMKAWGDSRGIDLDLETVKNRLENTGKEAFIQRVNWLEDGTILNGSWVKNIVPQIIFDELGIPYGEYRLNTYDYKDNNRIRVHQDKLLKALEKLNEGSLGCLTYSYKVNQTNEYAGHMITVYGFKPGSTFREFKRLMSANNNHLPNEKFESLLPNLGELLCYEQDNEHNNVQHHSITLKELLSGNKYLESELILVDGDSSERDVTIVTLLGCFSDGEFAAILRPPFRETFNSLSDEQKTKYVLSRAWDLGARTNNPEIFDCARDYLPAQ